MKCTRCFYKISKVPTRSIVPASSLVYHPRYSTPHAKTLSRKFDVVTEANRFLSLELLLKKLSGYVGRRQYKMNCDMTKYVDHLRDLGIDWHELKYLHCEELMQLLNEQLQLNHAERAVLLSALGAKVCGVLKRSSTRHSTNLCLNPGKAEHGWRCGEGGHTNDVYFEGKQKANTAALHLAQRSALRQAKRDGICIDVRSEPDFSIVGRIHQESNRRIWSTPENPNFIVTPIGYEFRVHSDDPRASRQIEDGAAEWELHMNVVQQMIWEMLEMYATERVAQPLQLAPGEMGPPDTPQSYSSTFSTRTRSPDGSEEIVVEPRMLSTDGVERPWFQAPHPQTYKDGVPTILPFAPSVVVQSSFRQITRGSLSDDVTHRLMQPVLDVSLFLHPQACFWWNEVDEVRSVRHILDYAKRVPFALPFYLYFRVDPAKHVRLHPELEVEKEALAREKADWFDLRRFRETHGKLSQ